MSVESSSYEDNRQYVKDLTDTSTKIIGTVGKPGLGVFIAGMLALIVIDSFGLAEVIQKHEEVYCKTASRKLRDGEQNICYVLSKTKVTIKVDSKYRNNFAHYLFDLEPSISSVKRTRKFTFNSTIKPKEYAHFEVPLPFDSEINAKLFADNDNATWCFSKDRWMDSRTAPSFMECIWSEKGSGAKTLSMTIDDSRVYYLYGVLRDDITASEMSISWEIDVTYTTYDLSDGERVCEKANKKCVLDNLVDQYIVSELKEGTVSDDKQLTDSIITDKSAVNKKAFNNLLARIIISGIFAVFATIGLIIWIKEDGRCFDKKDDKTKA